MGAMNDLALLSCDDIAWFRHDPALPSAARGAAATLARRIGLDSHRASEVALAVTEAATNLHQHTTDGALLLRVVRTASAAGVELLTVDTGPGMADVAEALMDGTSTAGTLGIGLGAVARLADRFDIHSLPGKGTVLAAQFWPRTPGNARTPTQLPGLGATVASGVTRPISGETSCGDAWAVRVDPGTQQVGLPADGRGGFTSGQPESDPTAPALLVMLCDGLGHGPLAALAADAAVKAFRQSRMRRPDDLLRDIHTALRGTRGGAVAVARVEPAAQRLLYCGIGNVSGFLIGPDSRSGLMSAPGIVGQQMRSLRTFELPLPQGGALVMHSDGLSERWAPQDMPGLLRHTPAVIAGQLLREAAVRRDDAGIVVIKGAW
ncbi:ATP-binding SpoIIE family protein phosphatase [Streptomyces maoxianensis]|uniref:ATP-binding SpoIIE family protein phosphatase n=2 Tax=Streptomyces maoxianensis TaxID=1459942 RepID=A0ABV9G4Z8_9ACTN